MTADREKKPGFVLLHAATQGAPEDKAMTETDRARETRREVAGLFKHLCQSCDLDDEEYAARENFNKGIQAVLDLLASSPAREEPSEQKRNECAGCGVSRDLCLEYKLHGQVCCPDCDHGKQALAPVGGASLRDQIIAAYKEALPQIQGVNSSRHQSVLIQFLTTVLDLLTRSAGEDAPPASPGAHGHYRCTICGAESDSELTVQCGHSALSVERIPARVLREGEKDINQELLESLRECVAASAAAMRVVAMLNVPDKDVEWLFVAELHKAGVKDGFGVRAKAAIEKAEKLAVGGASARSAEREKEKAGTEARTCLECRQVFPDFTISSSLRCHECRARSDRGLRGTEKEWRSVETEGPDGVGGQVWVAYPNPNHPKGWNLRVQFTPIMREMGPEPVWWKPVEQVDYPASLPSVTPEVSQQMLDDGRRFKAVTKPVPLDDCEKLPDPDYGL